MSVRVPHDRVTVSDPWKRQDRAGAAPWRVVVRMPGRTKSIHFATREEARAYARRALDAKARGEWFDVSTGEPESFSLLPGGRATSVFSAAEATCTKLMGRGNDGDGLAPGGRKSKIQRIAWAVLGLSPLPTDVTLPTAYRVLVLHLRGSELDPPDADVIKRMRTVSPPIAAVDKDRLKLALATMATNLGGAPASATTRRNRRQGLSHLLADATEHGLMPGNVDPMGSLPRSNRGKRAASGVGLAISADVVGDATEVWTVLDRARKLAVMPGASPRDLECVDALELLFAVGARPEEILGLQGPDVAPGAVTFRRTVTRPGAAWADGETVVVGPLKHRKASETRTVPIPVAEIARRAHWRAKTTARGDYLFGVTDSDLSRVWRTARDEVADGTWPEARLARPYALRHSAASIWLDAGVPPAEVARRLGHSVQTLLSTYASVIRTSEEGWTARISDAMNRSVDTPG